MADIAVIGAGLGGMAAAARLSVAGHHVAVYERNETHGGGVRCFRRDGFGFDTSPGLLQLPAVYRDLFVKTGRAPLEECVQLHQPDPAAQHIFPDGTAVSLPNASHAGVIDALDAALGAGSGDRWAGLLGRARQVWDTTRRPLLEEPRGPGTTLARAVTHDPYPARRTKGLLRRRSPTLSEVGRDELRDPRLVSLLESYAHTHGLDPSRTPASATVLPYLEHTFGSWYVRGGIRALADALYERCLARRVEFHFDTEVRRVHEQEGRVTGLEVAGRPDVPAAAVVHAEPPTAAQGTGVEHRRARLTVLLALRGARPEGTPHRTVLHRSASGAAPVTVLRPDDATLRPDDAHESVVLSVPVWPQEVPDRAAAGRLADHLVAAADAAGLGLGGRELWREVRTPGDNEAETGAPGGRIPAPALAGTGGHLLPAANRQRVTGRYYAGGWAHPGGGLSHAGMSGALVAGLLVEGDDWRGSQ